MEPVESKIVLLIGLVDGGWCVLNAENMFILSGPYQEHSEAVSAAQTRAWRIAQGWAP